MTDTSDRRETSFREVLRRHWKRGIMLILAAAAALGWVGFAESSRCRNETAAIGRYRALGAVVDTQPRRSWLSPLFGPSDAVSAKSVSFPRRWASVGYVEEIAMVVPPKGAPGDFVSYPVGVEDARMLSSMPAIEELDLAFTDIRDEHLDAMRLPDRMGLLDLSHTKVSGEGILRLTSGRKIQRLVLSGLPLTSQTLAGFSKSQIEELDLAGCSLADDDVATLSSWTSLRALNVRRNRISDHSIDSLLKIASLRRVDVTGTHITVEGTTRLVSHLEHVNSDADERHRMEVSMDRFEEWSKKNGDSRNGDQPLPQTK
jgi:hypothetical protein